MRKYLIFPLLLVFLIPSSAHATSVTLELLQLKVENKWQENKYSREAFGEPWSDVDQNNCDTRNDILARDLQTKILKYKNNQCIIGGGTLLDPYTGKSIKFKQGYKSSLAVQIDHVVSLANAWYHGAWSWSEEERLAFANDPLNLLAVDGPTNAFKSDKDITQFKPSNRSYQCKFTKIQIDVKYKYHLSVTSAEKKLFQQIITRCMGM